ncbi:Double Clp-N motif-containing P-loop nucleoside triphosphate hydrolases superfamily protein [Euphorbia peplus]|nr:Double Clp-N motif-containing P-loop nucleoside triphosphate hydrolases superfamily protein [Euphorbia peplus]
MPTPLTTARQCLTPESAHALDEAVTVARRRGHGQTTSLHAVSALLSLPSSILRAACARARNSAYSPRLQFKALELCLNVSLDRVPANQLSPEDPPVSNSLMAAIKRSQANQRRQPENFNLYHHPQTSSPSNNSMSCVKVELRNLILSILDDPVVSRVFGEAGFPSSEIKLAIIRPLPQVFKFSRFKAPPVFLCNLGSDNPGLSPGSGPGRRGFSFPFMGFGNGDENWRRIGEVLGRDKGRNPLLIGVCAYDALKSFSDGILRRKDNILPPELLGVKLISIENDIRNQNSEKGCLDLKFEEMKTYVEGNSGSGVILNVGDLKLFEDMSDSMIQNLTKLLGKKVWLIGSISSYECYLKLISRFPCIEKDWDLQLLPITSVRSSSMTESHPKSSLMESFVPFGGFFSTLSELNSSYQSISRCHQCNEKCEQEIVAVSKDGLVSSVADQYQSNLPSWLQMTEVGTNKGSDAKTRDDGVVLGAKVAGVQNKWDSICRRLHHARLPGSNIHPSRFPSVVGFHRVEDKKEDAEKCSSNITSASIDLQDSRKLLGVPIPEIHTKKPSREDHPESDGIRFPCSFSNSSLADSNQESPPTVTSVTTDLGLRINHVPTCDNRKNFVSISGNSSSSSSLDFVGQFDSSNFKKIFRALIEEVSWQDEAVRIISETIAHCRTRNENGQEASQRRYIWLNFRGSDRCGMKKIVSALAEIVYGSREKLISADLSPENLLIRSQSHDVMFRGKTVIDYVGDELSKKPSSVVFLENVNQAEVPTQNCLSRAIQTGRFSYSNGREVGISNAIFVTTSAFSDDEMFTSRKDFSAYSEEKILRAKGFPMQLLLEQAPTKPRRNVSDSMFMNKRKTDQNLEEHQVSEFVKRAHVTPTRNLDLNLPAEDNAQATDDQINSDNDSTSGNSRSWLLDFVNQLDRTVIFKPFDFDALAERMLNNINESFHKIVGKICSFDIDLQVLEQLLAAAYLSGRERVVEKWVEEVLNRGFVEFSKRYNLNADSVVKLVACKGMFLGEHLPGGINLPSKILF